MVEETKATFIVTQAASFMPWFCNSSPYHLVEKPPQTVTNLDSLKLNKINNIIGIYKNENPTISEKILKLLNFFMRLPSLVTFGKALLGQRELQVEGLLLLRPLASLGYRKTLSKEPFQSLAFQSHQVNLGLQTHP